MLEARRSEIECPLQQVEKDVHLRLFFQPEIITHTLTEKQRELKTQSGKKHSFGDFLLNLTIFCKV